MLDHYRRVQTPTEVITAVVLTRATFTIHLVLGPVVDLMLDHLASHYMVSDVNDFRHRSLQGQSAVVCLDDPLLMSNCACYL